MKKSLFLVLWSLILVSGLCGVFSINESPSGHVYNPSFDQCESYTIIPITESSITIYPDNHDSTINATTIYSTDGAVPFTIESLLFALRFEIRIDGVKISNMVGSGWDVCFTRNLGYGHHGITIDWYELDGAHYSNSFSFLVIPYNHYFQNSWSKLYPYSNGSSQFGAVRPALIVEGFSIPGLISGNAWSVASKWNSSMSTSKRYILTFSDPFDHVQDNAMVVLGALRFIHNSQTTPLVEGTSIYGYSMGGILARYALAYAEQWNIQHFCTQYVSIDSPHRGATINLNLQNTMQSLENALDDYGKSDERLDAALSALNSQAAKQLIRENKNADNNSYNAGSHQYRSLFAEINEEDNLIHELLDGDPMSILNASPDSYEGALKPGFPYKQNNVKSFAYSNGGLGISGNVNNDPLAVSWSLDVVVFPNDSGQAAKCEYDRQPGSVLEDFSTSDSAWYYDFELTQNYAPVLVPTRSSLYLKRNSMSGGSPIPELEINTNYLSALTDYADDLLDHTYFDQIVHATDVPYPITEAPIYVTDENGNQVEIIIPHKEHFNEWNWRHGELGWSPYEFDNWVVSNIATSTNWLNQIENRSVCMIKGQIDGSDFSNITGTILINGQGHGSFSIDQNGFYSIPYLYTKDATVRLVFEMPGCMPSYRDININYSNAMLHDQIVPNATMYALNLNDIRVSSTGNGSFYTINQAIDFVQSFVDSGLYAGEAIRIRVGPGTYSESVDLSPLAALGITNFTLEGVGEAIINGDGYGIKLVVNENSPSVGAVYNIKKLKIANSDRGILFKDYWDESSMNAQAPQLTLNISNCTIYDCGTYSYSGTGTNIFSAAAIHFEGGGSITSCHFLNNSISAAAEYSQFSQAGGVFIRNNTTSTIEVKYNEFTSNKGLISGGLVATGTGPIRITNDNKFFGNTYGGYGSIANAQRANALSVYDASNIILKNNLFVDNIPSLIPYGAVIGLTTYLSQAAAPIRFINNTIVNTPQYNTNGLSAIKFRINAGVTVQDIQIKNNIISSTNSNGCTIDSNAGYSPVSINYNMLHNTSLSGFSANLYNPEDPNSVYNPSAPKFNYQCDPQLDANYVPLWNATTMSHCIDTGTGVNDSDGTPPDIGAFQSADHRYWQYRFRSGENDRSDSYHWVSYPVVNSLTQGKTVARSFFHELLGTHEIAPQVFTADVLQEIVWYESNQSRYIVWDGSGWGPFIDTHNVVSPQGYKVKLLSVDNSGLPPTTVELHHSGFLTPDNTPFMVYGSASNGVQTYENWIGYFDTESVWPTDAFASIWNDIKMIKAKDWCLYRDPNSGVGALIGKMLPINCGDMVIVTTVNDHEFQWNTIIPTDPKKKEVPTAFEYVEKADYTPVYIDLSAVDLSNLKEIGLKLDGICKGAVVVTDSLEQICAYLEDGESLSSGLVELVFFYESKSQPLEMRSVAINDKQLSSNMIGGDSAYPVYNIKVSTSDLNNLVVPVLSLVQNYPNPFNPTTSIRYSIEETGPVSLDIYNIKGQLVKTLYHGNAEIGSHTAIWNGLDNSGNACSSGVYFYRLRTPKTSLVRKMLMLK